MANEPVSFYVPAPLTRQAFENKNIPSNGKKSIFSSSIKTKKSSKTFNTIVFRYYKGTTSMSTI